MKQKASQTLFAYWNDVRAGRIAPRRLDIEPSRIAVVLPDALILERVDFETFRFRLAGTRLCEHFGSDVRGLNLFELFDESSRITLERQCAAICKQAAVGVFNLTAEYDGAGSVPFELVLHPLLHTSQTIDRLLGAMSPVDGETRPPGLAPTGWRITGHTLIWPDGRPHQIAGAMAATQEPFADHIRRARIVRSDRRQFRVYDGGLSKPRPDAP